MTVEGVNDTFLQRRSWCELNIDNLYGLSKIEVICCQSVPILSQIYDFQERNTFAPRGETELSDRTKDKPLRSQPN